MPRTDRIAALAQHSGARARRSRALPSLRALAVLAGVAAAVFVPAFGVAEAQAQGAAGAAGSVANDYPTEVRADYVFGCMAVNGQTQLALQRCSCSVDVVASILPYEKYEKAQTILMMRQGVGQTANTFRSTPMFDDMVADLRRAQAEAEMRCFP